AVVNDDANVLHGIARDGALLEQIADAFFDGGDELAGDGAAEDFIDELEALAALERLDAQENFAELSGAAGLLLVAVVAFGVVQDRLFVRDLGRLGIDREPAVF